MTLGVGLAQSLRLRKLCLLLLWRGMYHLALLYASVSAKKWLVRPVYVK